MSYSKSLCKTSHKN